MFATQNLTRWDVGQPIPVDLDEISSLVRSLRALTQPPESPLFNAFSRLYQHLLIANSLRDGERLLLFLPLIVEPPESPAATEPDGLEKLGSGITPFTPKLITFYLVGRELREGQSLREAAKALQKLHETQQLPENPPTSHSSLSKLLGILAKNVFDRYFGREGTHLLASEPGRSGRLSADGCTAWELTRAYLDRNNWLPDCRSTDEV